MIKNVIKSGLLILFTVFVSNSVSYGAPSLNAAEKAYLEGKENLKICIDPKWMPYEGINEFAKHVGMSADYMALLSNVLDKEIILHPTKSWRETLEAARARQCDMITMARETQERKSFLYFTEPYVSFPYVIATTTNKPYIGLLAENLDKTFAVVKGYAIIGFLKESYPDIKLLEVDNFEDGIKRLRTGEADGYLDSLITLGYYITENGLLDIKIAGEVDYKSSLSIATRNDEPLLKSVMQTALDQITEAEKKSIFDKWLTVRFEQKPQNSNQGKIIFSPLEKEYLIENTQVNMCVDPNWMPYEAIFEGKHTGIGNDMLQMIIDRIGIDLKLIQTRTWDESLQFFKQGKCDILSMVNKTPERDTYMDYTSPYFRGHIVFVAKNEHEFIAEPEGAIGKKVVVASGYSIAEFLKRDFPGIHLMEVENYDIAFEMVAKGEADLTADYLISSGDRIRNQGLFGLKIAGNTPYKNELRIGVQKDLPVLLSLLEKSIQTLEAPEINAIINKWRSVRYEQEVDYTLFWQAGLGGLFVLCVIFLWNRQLVKANAKTRKALNRLADAQEELERLATTDKLTNLFNRRKIEEAFENEIHRADRFNHHLGLILMDIDHFKSVNDTHGHQAGDEILIRFAQILNDNMRDTDLIGRWGGEEFILLCPETDKDGVFKLAEKLRKSIEAADFGMVGPKTASFGTTIYKHSEPIDEMIKRADDALYQAKEKGRNCIFSK